MAIRVDCNILGHKGEWIEYKSFRFKDRRRYENAVGSESAWEATRDCIMAWSIKDADGNEMPQPSANLKLDGLDELSEPVFSWVIGSFWEAVMVGRLEAQSPPSSEQSD